MRLFLIASLIAGIIGCIAYAVPTQVLGVVDAFWIVLCLNVTAGIGVLAVASPMLQEMFGGSLVGQPGVGFAGTSFTIE